MADARPNPEEQETTADKSRAWRRNVLVVANVTAISDELFATLEERAARGPTTFTLIVPATPSDGGRAGARERLRSALGRLGGAGLEVHGSVASGDPILAVSDAWDPRRYDEIIVCTLPLRVSKWLHVGLPERVAKLTGALVTHVVAEPHLHVEGAPLPPRQKSTMGALTVLDWGGPRESTGHRRRGT